MFKEFETELLSIISPDPIEKISHMPTKGIAKTLDLVYNIKFDTLEKIYTESIDKMIRAVVVYNDKSEEKTIDQDICLINGKIYHITFIPSYLLNTDDNNAITMCRSIIKYISIRLGITINEYSQISSKVKNNIFDLVTLQCIPVITASVMRKIYSGPTLSKVIYMTLCDIISAYKKVLSEEGINSILNLFDEGLGVEELIDNSLICAIPCDDKDYPGIWCSNKNKEEE